MLILMGRFLQLLVPALLMPFLAPAGEHWSLRPVVRTDVPGHASADPVSWFVGEGIRKAGLESAPPAERRDWIRRLHYNLTGLPPGHEALAELVSFEGDDQSLAEKLVDELLASPRYGERWARHWLDVVRYSDTKGYAYAGEEFNFPHAWVYRDWVVRSFNEDLPYDHFIQRQLAADLLLAEGSCDRVDLAAMGFLTLGRRFLGVEPDIIDDRIDVVTRGVLALTVSCARCHDHKFDPIPTADYYALYGVFKSSRESLEALDPKMAGQHGELLRKRTALAAEFEKRATEMEGRFLARAGDYMVAALDISQVPPPDFAEIIEGDDLIPAQIRRWYEFLSQEKRRQDPVFGPWVALARNEVPDLSMVNPLVAEALGDRSGGLMVMAERYQELLRRSVNAEKENRSDPWQELREVVEGPGSPIRIPREYIHDVEWLFDDENKGPLKKAQAALDREVIKLREQVPHALALVDRSVAGNVRVFGRGQYLNQEEEVPRGSLGMLHDGRRPRYHEGSGRLSLARELTDTRNPLTARVIVNRIWREHFGEGLVRTCSDFGKRSESPTHPALLDYLASELMANSWSMKHVQRLIATSALYRIRAGVPPGEDSENRLLSVYPRRRLDFEAMRDSMLAASGELDLRAGGPPGELFGEEASVRRSLYGRIDRQYLPSVLRSFDFANPELHSPRRYRTNVPQQALFLMNAPFTVARARALARRVAGEFRAEEEVERIEGMFLHVLARRPTAEERESAHAFIHAGTGRESKKADSGVETWRYGYGEIDEKNERITVFHPLPYFNGKAWGGGEKWPDGSLGWVRLTAVGGHAGNVAQHGAVRRWISPKDGTIRITGTIRKIEDCGDGIRGWLCSSRQGLLGAWQVEFGEAKPANLNEVEVRGGEVLDFVVDCGGANNFFCDGFEWAPRLELIGEEQIWDARTQFGGKRHGDSALGPWERLAQALLISNEAMFLD